MANRKTRNRKPSAFDLFIMKIRWLKWKAKNKNFMAEYYKIFKMEQRKKLENIAKYLERQSEK